WFPIQAEMGDQVLLGRGTVGEAGKELSGHLAALAVDRRNRLAQRRFQRQGIEAVQQLLMQLPPVAASIGQAAPIEDRVALAAGSHQVGGGQYLQMVTDA